MREHSTRQGMTARASAAHVLSVVVLVLLAVEEGAAQQRTVGGVTYEKLATRVETERQMLRKLRPELVEWGEWQLCGPFPYGGHGRQELRVPHGPEQDLLLLRPGDDRPDLTQTYTGKSGVEARWQSLGPISNKVVKLGVYPEPELNNFCQAYLYGTATVQEQLDLELNMGSDDGLRLWLNGRLLVDNDVPRGLNPFDERVKLRLQPGENHLLAKVAQGQGGWDYQILTSKSLPPRLAAELEFQLDRDFPPTPERKYYDVLTIPQPDAVVLEVGGVDTLPDGRPIVCTRRGDVFVVDNAWGMPPHDAEFKLFAQGLQEPLGLQVRREGDQVAVYLVQRSELTRLIDVDGDDRADRYETVCADWGVSGNYHEFAFGPLFDDDGNAWVTLNVGFCGSLGKSTVPYRGWALKVTPQGEMIPVCGGLRSPNGIGRFDGEMFYVDNQGDWVATNRLSWLQPGSWHGHPSGLRWREDRGRPVPPIQPASVWFPYKKMGQSAADVVTDTTAGKFGPFAGQIFVGDQTLATIMRVDLEKVAGFYQGACFPFLSGLASGVNRMAFADDGSMLVGMTDRGWGSIGARRDGLQRVCWKGTTPFEILSMRITPVGFRLTFTGDVEPASAANPASYSVKSYTYEHHKEYGCPELQTSPHQVLDAKLISKREVELTLNMLKAKFVHELLAAGVRSSEGEALLHPQAYYTVQMIPAGK